DDGPSSMSADTAGDRPGSADAGADAAAAKAQTRASVEAGIRLVAALRRVITAELALLAAEARVLRESVAVVFLAGVALVALAVSLWVCIVALIGWAFVIATHSVGIALGLLVVLHLILVSAVWFTIMRAVRRASFPQARVEFAALGRAVRRDLDRFQRAAPPAPPEEPVR
ncbi:MAG: hypothetical protein ACREP0_11100, partial [Rhodanobacteraceae bacterium]